MFANPGKRLSRSASAAVLAATLLRAAAASADPPSARPVPAPPPAATTAYSFEDDAVLAAAKRPLGEVLRVRSRSERGSLVRAREHFVAELLASVESL